MRVFALCLLLTLPFSVGAYQLSGRVAKVVDGDTVKIVKDGKAITVRLVEIDAPELSQPYGFASKKTLEDLCYKQIATITWSSKDRYGRILGRLSCNGVDANAYQIAQGMAWWYTEYGQDQTLKELEGEVRSQCLGLWNSLMVRPPWVYRQNPKAVATENRWCSATPGTSIRSGCSYTKPNGRIINTCGSSGGSSGSGGGSSSGGSSGGGSSSNNSHNYITGPRGGCYYINSSGNKEYVSHSLCN